MVNWDTWRKKEIWFGIFLVWNAILSFE